MRIVSRVLAGSRIALIARGEEGFCSSVSKRSQVKSSQVKLSRRKGDLYYRGTGCACAAGLIPASSFERDAASTGLEHLGRVPAFSSPKSPPGDGTFVIEFGYICYQDTYPMYLACIVHVSCMYSACILMCPVKYIKIHFSIAFRYIRVQDACILMYPDKADMYPVLHQGSA